METGLVNKDSQSDRKTKIDWNNVIEKGSKGLMSFGIVGLIYVHKDDLISYAKKIGPIFKKIGELFVSLSEDDHDSENTEE